MEVKHLNSFILKNKVKRHDEVKHKLIDLITNNESDSTEYDGGFISRTDYHLDENHTRTYLPLFFEIIEPILQEQAKFFLSKEANVHHAWFQQYYMYDKHNWHNHGKSNFASIYYLELPDTNMKTQFFDILDKKIIDNIDIEEGDLITFPAYIIHRSNTNTLLKKTIISYNCSFETIDAQKVDKLL